MLFCWTRRLQMHYYPRSKGLSFAELLGGRIEILTIIMVDFKSEIVCLSISQPFQKNALIHIFWGALSAQTLIHSGDMDNNLYLSQYYCTDLRLGCSLFRALCIKDSCTFHNVNYGPVFVCPLIMAWLG